MSPVDSEDLTGVIKRDGKAFAVLWSPGTAEEVPDYHEVARFPTRKLAEDYIYGRIDEAGGNIPA
jgi:hypothetical protein